MSSPEIRGRFLPSRIYFRWKWAVHLGLLVVTFLVFLSGGLNLYLAQGKYRSSTLFEVENGPPPQEIVKLLKADGILKLVTRQLGLAELWEVDTESTVKILRGATTVKIVPDTRLIEVQVSVTDNEIARDIAAQIPKRLVEYLGGVVKQRSTEKAEQLAALIRRASDAADEKSLVVVNLEKVHGATPADASLATVLQRARRASLLADAEVERLQTLRADCLTGSLDALPRLVVHSEPTISQTPEDGTELGEVVIISLVSGLLTALLLPYLMEFAIPPRRGRISAPDPVDAP